MLEWIRLEWFIESSGLSTSRLPFFNPYCIFLQDKSSLSASIMLFLYLETSRGPPLLIKLNSNMFSDIHDPPNPNNIHPLLITMTTTLFTQRTKITWITWFALHRFYFFFFLSPLYIFPWSCSSRNTCSYITSNCLNSTDSSEPISEIHVCKKPHLIYLCNKYLSARH